MKKRGLSPIIATVLLIGIVLTLAAIILIWARSALGETVEKQEREVSRFCPEVSFSASIQHLDNVISSGGSKKGMRIIVENTGAVPIFDVEVRSIVNNDVRVIPTLLGESEGSTVSSGQTGTFNHVYEDQSPTSSTSNNDVIIVPILLGETEKFKKTHTCDEQFGIETIVSGP